MSHRKQSRMNAVAMMMVAGGLAAALPAATEPANAQNPGVSNQPRGGLGGPDTRPENFGIKQGTANKGGAVSIQDGGNDRPAPGRGGIDGPDIKPGGKLRVPSQLK